MMRLHPFGHVFADLVPQLAAVRVGAAAARRDTADRSQFASLQGVRDLVADLEDPDTVEGDPDAVDHYVTALWTAYRFWDAGEPTVEVPKQTLAPRLDHPEPSATPSNPVYARLPERWVWAQVAPSAPHEPIDGLFVVPGAAGRDLTVLAVLGLRADRPGFGQITVHAAHAEASAAFGAMRDPPFAPVVDGGSAAGIRSAVTRGELVVLSLLAAAVGE